MSVLSFVFKLHHVSVGFATTKLWEFISSLSFDSLIWSHLIEKQIAFGELIVKESTM